MRILLSLFLICIILDVANGKQQVSLSSHLRGTEKTMTKDGSKVDGHKWLFPQKEVFSSDSKHSSQWVKPVIVPRYSLDNIESSAPIISYSSSMSSSSPSSNNELSFIKSFVPTSTEKVETKAVHDDFEDIYHVRSDWNDLKNSLIPTASNTDDSYVIPESEALLDDPTDTVAWDTELIDVILDAPTTEAPIITTTMYDDHDDMKDIVQPVDGDLLKDTTSDLIESLNFALGRGRLVNPTVVVATFNGDSLSLPVQTGEAVPLVVIEGQLTNDISLKEKSPSLKNVDLNSNINLQSNLNKKLESFLELDEGLGEELSESEMAYLLDVIKPELLALAASSVQQSLDSKAVEENLIESIKNETIVQNDALLEKVAVVISDDDLTLLEIIEDAKKEREAALDLAKEEYLNSTTPAYLHEHSILENANTIISNFVETKTLLITREMSRSKAEAQAEAEELFYQVQSGINEEIAAANETVLHDQANIKAASDAIDQHNSETETKSQLNDDILAQLKIQLNDTESQIRINVTDTEQSISDAVAAHQSADMDLSTLLLKLNSANKQSDDYMIEMSVFNDDINSHQNNATALNNSLETILNIEKKKMSDLEERLAKLKEQFLCEDGSMVYDTSNCVEGPKQQLSAVENAKEQLQKSLGADDSVKKSLQDQIDAINKDISDLEAKKAPVQSLIDDLKIDDLKLSIIQAKALNESTADTIMLLNMQLETIQNQGASDIATLNDKINTTEVNNAQFLADAESKLAGLKQAKDDAIAVLGPDEAALKVLTDEADAELEAAQGDLDAIRNGNSTFNLTADASELQDEYNVLTDAAKAERERMVNAYLQVYQEKVKSINAEFEARLYDALSHKQEIIGAAIEKELYDYQNPPIEAVKARPLLSVKEYFSKTLNDTIAIETQIVMMLSGSLPLNSTDDVAALIAQAQAKDAEVVELGAKVIEMELQRQTEEKLAAVTNIKESIQSIYDISTRSGEKRDESIQEKNDAIKQIQAILDSFKTPATNTTASSPSVATSF